MSDDGFWRPDVRSQFVTNDGAVILMAYTGLVEQTEAFKQAAEADRETDWSDQYMRLSVVFETGSHRYTWLNNKSLLQPWAGSKALAQSTMRFIA